MERDNIADVDDLDSVINSVIGVTPTDENKPAVAHVGSVESVGSAESAESAEPAVNTDADAVVEKFDLVQSQISSLRSDLDAIGVAQGMANKIEALRTYVTRSQIQIESMYDLLVEMNNFFGKPM